MDEDNMMAELNMRNGRKEDVTNELAELVKAAPNLTDEVEIAVNKAIQQKIKDFKQMVDREADEAQGTYNEYKLRVEKEKEDEKFYKEV